MQTTAIGTVTNSLPQNEVILLTLLISGRYISYTDLHNNFVKHDFAESKLNHSLCSISMELVVYRQPSEVFQPCECSFNNPSFRNDLEL